MKHALVLIVGIVFAFSQGCSDVKTGEIVRCKQCNKEILNTIHDLKVAFWNASKYSITTKLDYCGECGSQHVTYVVSTKCKNCGNTYKTETKDSLRREEKNDMTLIEGYCVPCDTPIQWSVTVNCQRCGKFLQTYVTQARPRDHAKSSIAYGFCGWCGLREKVKGGMKSLGELGGDAIEGLIKGAENR